MSPFTVLITGANRGIGRGLVKVYLARPSTTVIAAVRDLEHVTSKSLQDLPTADGSRLITIQLDSTKPESTAVVIGKLKAEHGVASLDVVLANAGISLHGSRVRESSIENINQHLLVNAVAPVALFQATADLLQASKTGNPTFIALSTLAGSIRSIDGVAHLPLSPYGGSKAALNWFIRRLHFEEPWLTSLLLHPGLIETDLTVAAIEGTAFNLSDMGAVSVDAGVADLMKIIDKATREIGGTFQSHDGTELPW
ncbi:hypothetical protein NM208_g8983 [Fusarium decemcellulare]|uniref:Uncharacterized protein n=1 Tax=Fusarium decemcellulare TaxID=57161 RepID=A0ACC1S382_9HYPO|nr:hypothetical protein NM208_g8983 [Fusarium decemcellulare]